jgi:hypothetical protein
LKENSRGIAVTCDTGSVENDRDTVELLRRPLIIGHGFRYIGKETDRRWEQGEDISILESDVVKYRPDETARLVMDPMLNANIRSMSIRARPGRWHD